MNRQDGQCISRIARSAEALKSRRRLSLTTQYGHLFGSYPYRICFPDQRAHEISFDFGSPTYHLKRLGGSAVHVPISSIHFKINGPLLLALWHNLTLTTMNCQVVALQPPDGGDPDLDEAGYFSPNSVNCRCLRCWIMMQ